MKTIRNLRYIFMALLIAYSATMPLIAAPQSNKAKTTQTAKKKAAADKKKAAKQKAKNKKKEQAQKQKQKTQQKKAATKAKKTEQRQSSQSAQDIKRYNARRFDIHNLYFYGGAGYSGLLNKGTTLSLGTTEMGETKFVGGAGGMLGIGYEYNYKHFALATGPEFRLLSSTDRLNFSEPYTQALSEYNQTKRYHLNDLREQQLPMQVMLPVMMGAKFDYWYFLAGAKVGWTVLNPFNQKGTVVSAISDPEAWSDEWLNLPKHGAVSEPYLLKGKNKFGLDLTASAEIGINLDRVLSEEWRAENESREHPWRMRLALFADYGIPRWSTTNEGAFAATTEQNITTRSLMSSDWAPTPMNSLLVGVKFTALLQLNKVREAKKQDGFLTIYTFDSKADRALSGVELTVQGETGRPTKKNTNGKGYFQKRMKEGDYTIHATRKGYLTPDDIVFSHGEDNDTARIGLRPVPVYRFVITDAKTGKAINAKVNFLGADNSLAATQTTDSIKGSGSVSLPVDGKYRIHIEAPEYLSMTVDLNDIDGEGQFALEPIIRKRTIILHDLYFATNSVVILPESESGLKDLYDLLNENPEIRIRIVGHTDSVGSDKDNQRLSEGRAASVKDDMVRRGIEASRIETEGKGESEPIDTNDTEEGRARNRRVEFVIL